MSNAVKYTDEFIKAIPKTDLHMHIDGSVRISTLIELAKEQNVTLPSYTIEGMREKVFKDSYESLNDYLKGFGYICSVMRNEEAIERICYELAIDNQEDGVRYIEGKFAPQLLMHQNLSFEQVMNATWKGFEKAKKEFNSNSKIKEDKEPPFNYGIIVCAMRFFTGGFSPFYKSFFDAHKYSDSLEVINLASIELAKASTQMIKNTGIPIVGFDLAGAEDGYPAGNHKEAFEIAHRNFLRKTVHAGEAYGPESIFQAITDLYAERIGHGFYLFDTSKILSDKNKANADKYVQDLASYIANSRVTLEVCPTSNLQTNPALNGDIKKHPLKQMLEHKLSITICTDNRLVSNTSVSKELKLVIDAFDINLNQLKNIIAYGFKRSFYHGSYVEKRNYVRNVLNYFDKVADDFNIK